MKSYLIILFSSFSVFVASQIPDQDVFKKCRKEFNKKRCLSDEDRDGILFYLDKCPKEFGVKENFGCPWPDLDKDGIIDKDDACPTVGGSNENNGCPWPDTDGDGILDKDDSCPTLSGLAEHNGCPKPFQRDCAAEEKRDSLEMIKLRIDYKEVSKVYNKLSRKILAPIDKYNLKNIGIYINLIDWGPMDIVNNGCAPNWLYIQSNYLITEFWNRSTLEYFYNKKNITRISLPKTAFPDLQAFLKPSLYDYLMKHSRKGETRVDVLKDNKIQNYIIIIIKVRFENPYKLTISMTDGNRFSIDTHYEYNGKDWNTVNQ